MQLGRTTVHKNGRGWLFSEKLLSLDNDCEFLIGELHTRDGVGATTCEAEFLVSILNDRDIA
jgi:hypothetical protein